MKKKYWMGIICLAAAAILCCSHLSYKKPKLISSITVMDMAYLTVLVDKKDGKDVEKLETMLLEMCENDSFEEIKLQTEDKPMPKRFQISVYISEKDLERGNVFLTIKKDE